MQYVAHIVMNPLDKILWDVPYNIADVVDDLSGSQTVDIYSCVIKFDGHLEQGSSTDVLSTLMFK